MRFVVFCIVVAGSAGCEPPGYHKGGSPDAATADGARDAGTSTDAAAPDSATPGACSDMFRLDGHGAAMTCWVTGDFIAWGVDPDHGAIVLAKGTDGAWTGTHVFTPGTYQYKFIVDSTMYLADPNDPDVVDDGFGGHNSVYTCTP
ncbi:MAG: glycogen-binding domain-containing protein [Kofleriaceae bacterium]